ncbi:hypothetical protein L211DRAFT_475230 [Terfezia boudieri ATCC MYA-4762]|uniref:Uncharacterized protein n=1 Tax=Terfezia boudieri ATCC MYA-4762 TaxID=1051890 RepID=A0A3N4LYF9_9PEZI|nr:hypothetical protein L211DRAFT_475230 [Terfezia boudieri ATCC MYA-4762]
MGALRLTSLVSCIAFRARRTWQINLPCPESTRVSGWLLIEVLSIFFKKKKKNVVLTTFCFAFLLFRFFLLFLIFLIFLIFHSFSCIPGYETSRALVYCYNFLCFKTLRGKKKT